METVPFATTFPTGKSSGSLQVIALSPLRAALLPLIFTVELPNLIVALLAGGDLKDEPGAVGECGGVLSAVLPTVAAGSPIMFTLLLREPFRIPSKGCSSCVGTGEPGGAGTMTICVSVAVILSPCLAAGCPTFF